MIKYKKLAKDKLFENSFYITLGRMFNAACGFLFWIVASRFYSPAEIGIATVIISSLGLILTFSKLGFDISLVRYMPLKDKSLVFNTSLIIVSLMAVILSALFIVFSNIIAHDISVIKNFAFIFIFLAFLSALTFTTESTFLAIRKGKYYFIQNIFEPIRIFALIPLAFLESFGIIFSLFLSTLINSFLAVFLITRFINFRPKLDRDFIRETSKLSSTNYVSSIMVELPSLLIPLFIINLLGPDTQAFYFISMTIGTSILLLIPDALSRSFFIEACNGLNLRKGIVKSLASSYVILLPSILFIHVFGDWVLGLFGKEYIEAFSFLKIYVISMIFFVVYINFIPILNIKKQYSRILELNFMRLLFILVSYYLLILNFGLIGVGYARILLEVITVIIILFWAKKDKLI